MDDFKVPSSTLQRSSPKAPFDSDETSFKKPPSDRSPQPQPQDTTKCPYIEPKWSTLPNSNLPYKFEVLKSGSIVEVIDNLQTQSFWVFGRLPANDIVMAHPTISRFHTVLQYRPNIEKSTVSGESVEKDDPSKFSEGWYLYDLGSTHGTFLNKVRIPAMTYIPVRVGHMVTLGASTRKFILQGPEFDEEPESELTVTELKVQRAKQEEEKRKQAELQAELREKEGINWGMSEDADEETDLTINPYATTNNEELFLNDPKKTLRGFFEREGLNLDYNVDELSPGSFVCKVELPIDDTNGKPLIAEIVHKGKKKECVALCALEACRILDRHGVLRQSHHEPMKRRAPVSDSDDDDDFLDRTGDVERKKLRKATAGQNNILTHEELLKQETELLERIDAVKEQIHRYQEETKRSKEAADNDDLDDFMKNLSAEKQMEKSEIRKLRVEEQRLDAEHKKLQRLIKITTPAHLPSISTDENAKKKSFFPLFGKRNKTRFQMPQSTTVVKKPVQKELKSDEEEIEEDEPEPKEIEAKHDEPDRASPDSSIENIQKPPVSLPSSTERPESMPEINPKPVKGPAFIPPELLQTKDKEEAENQSVSSTQAAEDEGSHKTEEAHHKSIDDDSQNETAKNGEPKDEDMPDSSNQSKKRRNRTRIRLKGRDNVDMDDREEFEDEEKYSGWVPPQNQTGDGITSLNQRFGY